MEQHTEVHITNAQNFQVAPIRHGGRRRCVSVNFEIQESGTRKNLLESIYERRKVM